MLVSAAADSILEIRDLTVEIQTRRGAIRAVEGVNLKVREGRALGLVGESGSGKSVTCLAALGALPSTNCRVVSGEILFQGRDLLQLSESALRKILGVEISLVLQDPFSSLNPVLSIADQVSDPIYYHHLARSREISPRVEELLLSVKIAEPTRVAKSYPFELSGGMRQRVVIASALAGPPRLLIADEATSSLDVTVQAQLIKLLSDLRTRLRMSLLVVTHDFGVVANLCDDVAVMYCGQVVETGTTEEILSKPRHPYTKALLQAIPRPDSKGSRLKTIPGSPPDRKRMPSGCRFAPRCDAAFQRCSEVAPVAYQLPGGDVVRCHLYGGEHQ